jgi:hypothetical protein
MGFTDLLSDAGLTSELHIFILIHIHRRKAGKFMAKNIQCSTAG